jgi:hypothetical protein
LTEQWIDRCQGEIQGKKDNSLVFQTFPGFTKIFGCKLQILNECIEILTQDEIKRVLDVVEFDQRVKSAAKLFIDKLSNLVTREPRPHAVICAFPQDIIDTCATRMRGYIQARIKLTEKEKEILDMILDHQKQGQTTLLCSYIIHPDRFHQGGGNPLRQDKHGKRPGRALNVRPRP